MPPLLPVLVGREHLLRRYAMAHQVGGQETVVFLAQELTQPRHLARSAHEVDPTPGFQEFTHPGITITDVTLHIFRAAQEAQIICRFNGNVAHRPILCKGRAKNCAAFF